MYFYSIVCLNLTFKHNHCTILGFNEPRCEKTGFLHMRKGERTGLVVRASASGSGDPSSILGRVGVLFP